MIKKFICWLWGCKTVCKAYTGETMKVNNGLGMEGISNLYRWDKQSYCIRCGRPAQ